MRQGSTGIALNGAPSQYDCWVRSAAADSVKIDSRTFTELLSFAPPFGRLIHFYDLANRRDGDWSLFFLTDPTIILASIESFDLRQIEHRFSNALRQAKEGHSARVRQDRLRECVDELTTLAGHVDGWLKGMQGHSGSRPVRLFTGRVVTAIKASLAPALEGVTAITGERPNLSGLSRHWRSHRPAGNLPVAEQPESKLLDRAASEVEAVFDAFIALLEELKEFARRHLPETLQDSNHKPQIGLYIAFVHLFEIAQRTLNSLTARFSAFYYGDILKEQKAGPVPDSVYLTFTLDPAAGVSFASVPAGTQFPAGKEADGSAILYAADIEVTVSLAALGSLRALRCVMGPMYSVPPESPPFSDNAGSPPAPSVLQQVLGTTIDLKLMNDEAAGKGPASGPIPWPPFGNTSISQNTDIAVAAPVTLGFGIASNYLMLTGGDRAVTVELELANGFTNIEGELELLADVTGLHTEDVWQQVVGSAFDIWLSTTDGWFQLNAYSSAISPQSFSISFELSSAAAPLVAFNPSPDAPPPKPTGPDTINPVPELPTLKAYLRQAPVTVSGAAGTAVVYPLSLLAQVEIDSIRVATETTGLTGLAVSNSSGQVDTSTPFPVFGGTPVTGSYLQFTNEELFVKTPDFGSLTIDLLWYGLPQNTTGFTGYYQGYVLGVDGVPPPDPPLYTNQSFVAEICVIDPGSWSFESTPASPPDPNPPDAVDVFLFRASSELPPDCSIPIPAPDGGLCPRSVFSNLPIGERVPPAWYDPASSAIRITLAGPPYAFGNTLYASNVLNAAIEELPKPPVEELTTQAPRPRRAPATASDALSDAADALNAVVSPAATSGSGAGAPPSKDDIRKLVSKTQSQLLSTAQSMLSANLSAEDPALSGWVRQTFQVTGSSAAPYQARTIIKRLQQALQTVTPNGEFASPPGLSSAAAAYIHDAIHVLQGVVTLQQALDDSAAEPDSEYLSSIQSGLATAQQNLRPPAAYGDTSPPSSGTVVYPNTPWLPQAEALSVSYRAHCDFSPSPASGSPGVFFYLTPFGGYQQAPASVSAVSLLPIPEPGVLELGFTGLEIAQSLTMLAQMAAGSIVNPPVVSWEYLSTHDWVAFEPGQIPVDTTNQLQNTGFVTLNVPEAEPLADPASYRWLRAVTQQPDSFPDMIGIYPNPATATWVSTPVDGVTGSGQHLSKPLPPYTIKSSVENLSAVQSICQPIESFGGVPAETQTTFSMRIAERLRHKDRAVLSWDYEQLVLERFPTIWKVQALCATSAAGPNAPGHVLVTVVAGEQSLQTADPTEPLVSAEMLDQIQSYLLSLATPFAVIQVVNPVYVRITVNANVIFGGTEDGGGGIDELNSDLIQYLSPWFYNVERATMRGAYASEDAISQFIETRPYVDSIVDISFDYNPPREGLNWYFLTSATSHSITETVKPPASGCQGGKTQ